MVPTAALSPYTRFKLQAHPSHTSSKIFCCFLIMRGVKDNIVEFLYTAKCDEHHKKWQPIVSKRILFLGTINAYSTAWQSLRLINLILFKPLKDEHHEISTICSCSGFSC